jgi:histidine triad (HIT) family protein
MAERYSHAPEGYRCPFCEAAAGVDRPRPGTTQQDVVLRTNHATAFMASRWWPNNRGHVLVIPNAHFENVYDLPVYDAAQIHRATQAVALAMRATYGCTGISTRQHNQPDGNQDLWHYHLHVFPAVRMMSSTRRADSNLNPVTVCRTPLNPEPGSGPRLCCDPEPDLCPGRRARTGPATGPSA